MHTIHNIRRMGDNKYYKMLHGKDILLKHYSLMASIRQNTLSVKDISECKCCKICDHHSSYNNEQDLFDIWNEGVNTISDARMRAGWALQKVHVPCDHEIRETVPQDEDIAEKFSEGAYCIIIRYRSKEVSFEDGVQELKELVLSFVIDLKHKESALKFLAENHNGPMLIIG